MGRNEMERDGWQSHLVAGSSQSVPRFVLCRFRRCPSHGTTRSASSVVQKCRMVSVLFLDEDCSRATHPTEQHPKTSSQTQCGMSVPQTDRTVGGATEMTRDHQSHRKQHLCDLGHLTNHVWMDQQFVYYLSYCGE